MPMEYEWIEFEYKVKDNVPCEFSERTDLLSSDCNLSS